ncbi:MAG TPA: radical SAM protein [bacterium]|nr:radical SAM protein [bacterium]HNZ73308.1 radical SAM protein [bacterium]HOH67415.1 radical SAM protein [bacterium]HPN81282.1 radical SAM protein [bacterium]HPW39744.1 radical SAM protein [bacterium]
MPKKTTSKKINSDNLLGDISQKYANKPLDLLLSNAIIRKNIIKFADKKIRADLLKDKNYPYKVREDKYYMGRSMILAMDEAFRKAKNAPMVRKALVNSFIQNNFLKKKPQVEEFKKQFGFCPPGFLTIAPGKFCNLRCIGCYANSSSASAEKLDWDILDRIVMEKTNLWGSYFTVITGGEPFLYESQGKTIIDLAKKHQDNYFLIYTNGTLINNAMAKKLAEVGNITPAISVEGFEKETDERRGKGVHKKILQAMENLREAGVPFGISITATKNNADWILDDKTFDYYFNKQGAIYCWVFQFMPIGRSTSLKLMVTPKQRVKMFRQHQYLVKNKKLFVADFWNSGTVVDGCISAGREGGYLYIDWNGKISPCVFNPYSPLNINEVYKQGRTLNDVINAPFFKAIRSWQKEYYLEKGPEEKGNMIMTCPIKDHYEMLRGLIDKYHPEPMDETASQALKDSEYKKGLIKYHDQLAEATDPIWEKEYCQRCKKCEK